MNNLTVYGFETSNNIKVRTALGYKRIPFTFETIKPDDRSQVLQISGQHLTPVLTHGDRVLFDSAAILRYLDANFPETPKLFGSSRTEQWEIEDWEMFGRTALAGPMMQIVHRRIRGETIDEELRRRCGTEFEAAAVGLRAQLAGGDHLVGPSLSAADITAAAVLFRVRSANLLPTGSEASALEPWTDRVLSFDPGA